MTTEPISNKTIASVVEELLEMIKYHGGGVLEVHTADMTLSVEIEGERWRIGEVPEDD